ncbi:MAG: hypothetical protein K6F34_03825 [Lachnospiraceae bacterium]|nr:hypothetical protein [Lachnospiraceae bacterium]
MDAISASISDWDRSLPELSGGGAAAGAGDGDETADGAGVTCAALNAPPPPG